MLFNGLQQFIAQSNKIENLDMTTHTKVSVNTQIKIYDLFGKKNI